jgi:hypothetical protein
MSARYSTVKLGAAQVLRVGVTYGADAQPLYLHLATGSDAGSEFRGEYGDQLDLPGSCLSDLISALEEIAWDL